MEFLCKQFLCKQFVCSQCVYTQFLFTQFLLHNLVVNRFGLLSFWVHTLSAPNMEVSLWHVQCSAWQGRAVLCSTLHRSAVHCRHNNLLVSPGTVPAGQLIGWEFISTHS